MRHETLWVPFLKKHLPWLFALLILTALLGNHFFSKKKDAIEPAAPTAFSQKEAAPTKAKKQVAAPSDAPTFTTLHRGEEREFVLALDEAVERLPEGKDRTVKIDPPATSDTLASRLAALKTENPILPVCYRKGTERSLATRHIVTRDLTIELTNSETLPTLPDGVTLKERPVYAPNHAVVSAVDPFAALAALGELKVTPGVAEAEVQLAIQRSKKALPNDSLINQQWHIKASGFASAGSDVNIENAWLYGSTGGVRGNGVRIGIVDDGLQTAHPDLAANVDTFNDKDWNGNDNSPEPGFGDDHGTACAGNAGAVGNNNLGVAGTAPESTLVGMRLIAAASSDSQEAQAMFYLPDLIEIKSNSWGPTDSGQIDEPGSLTRAAFATAAASGRNGKGSLLVWAGGNGLESNDNSNYDGYANDIHTIAIGATNSRGQQSYFSESGANLIVVGPSSGNFTPSGITTTDRTGNDGYETGNYTSTFGGTSSSTPTVAGIIALMLEKNPNLGWRDVQEILIASARKNDAFDSDWATNAAGIEFNHKYGSGLVDATAAVALADGWDNLDDAVTDSESASSLNLNIPDNNSNGVSHDLTLDGTNIRCEQVTLTVSASHTYRGDLAITLTSPSGMVSQLAETRGSDGGSNYSGFTFSSVRHWGEDSNGTWTVQVADGASADTGRLNSLTLTVHGAPVAPRNPGPAVAITSPSHNSAFSPGASVNVSITATDETIDGSAGVVSSVELFNGSTSLGIDTTAPYNFTFSPALGIYNLTAVATDSEGEATTSAVASFVVADQIPVVTAATLTPSSQGFADQPLSVEGVTGNDPEGSPLSYNYTWENSSDGILWESTSISGNTLPVSPENAGLLWRVQVRANDGVSNSLPFTTGITNMLTRPPAVAMRGESIDYRTGLVIRGSGSTLSKDAIVNEFSQGSTGTSEWIEILVLREASLRNWKLSDTNFTSPLTFADVPAWDDVPAGTVLVVYNGSSRDPLLPPNDEDHSDNTLVVASSNTSLFSGGWPAFGNGGDAVILRDGNSAVLFRFDYGSRTSANVPNFGSAGSGESIYYTGSSEVDSLSPNFWTTTSSTVARELRGPRVPTTLPIVFGGDWTDLPAGFTSSGTGFYNTSLGGDTVPGSARFDSTGESITIEFNAPASTLSYQLRGNTGGQPNTSGTFAVEESADGVSFLPLRTFTDLGSDDVAYTDTPTSSTRFVRFRYQQKISGNIQLDKLAINPGGPGGNLGLSLSVSPNLLSENAGTTAATGTVIIEDPLAEDLVISLSSSNSAAVSIPATVTIPAGEVTATFPLETIDNTTFSGDQSLVIEASAVGFTIGSFKVTVIDDEENLIGVTPGAGNNLNNENFVAGLRIGAFDGPALFRLAAGGSLPDGLTLDPSTGLISGTIAEAATIASYPVTVERYNDFPEVTSFTFSLNVVAESNFSTWIAAQGVTEIAATDDPDGDGLVNLLEYYLAGDADSANPEIAPAIVLENGETRLGFWHLKTATDVTGIVEWSDTLEANSWSTTGVTSSITLSEASREYIEATIPTGASKRFVRLRVE